MTPSDKNISNRYVNDNKESETKSNTVKTGDPAMANVFGGTAIVSGVTLVFLLGTCLLMYIQVSSVLIENKTGIEAFKEAMLQNEFKAEFIKNMFMIFVFTAIGIVCAIIDEVRKNKRQSGI